MDEDKLLTTPEVAERLGVSVRRVQALIHAGKLPSQQFGRDHVIKESDLTLVAERKPGRPPKGEAEDAKQATSAQVDVKQAKKQKASKVSAPAKKADLVTRRGKVSKKAKKGSDQ